MSEKIQVIVDNLTIKFPNKITMEKIVEYINFESSNKFTLIFTSTTSRPVTRGNSGMSLHSKSHSPQFRKVSGTKVSNPHYNDTHLVRRHQQTPSAMSNNNNNNNSNSNNSNEPQHSGMNAGSAANFGMPPRSFTNTSLLDHSNDFDKSFHQREDSFILETDETNNANANVNYTPFSTLNNDEMFDQLVTKVYKQAFFDVTCETSLSLYFFLSVTAQNVDITKTTTKTKTCLGS